ncbi:MAG: hypothetical protein M0R74_09980 [Dehalococcoidia bacterium]|nr:hypothetical protein [Dehalococcoidia bacterium]
MTADEYWSHPVYRDGMRKSITVGNARDALQGEADAQAAERLAEAVAALRARADIVVSESVLEKAR